MLLQDLVRKNLIHPPKWLPDNTHYLAIVGSESYGANIQGSSDQDLQGFCIPPKSDVFPHLRGEIPGFGTQKQRFDNYQEHHIFSNEYNNEFDVSIYSIVRFFHLAMENNPNILDIICVPNNCIKFITPVGQIVRDNRKIFFHAGCFHKFRGYASAQMSKIATVANRSNPKRAATIDEFGFDTKFLMHVCRLALECEQILLTGDLDLKRDSQFLLSIRRGEMTLDDGKKWWASKERDLETAYANCQIVPRVPDEDKIKELLIACLDQHYGNLGAAVVRVPQMDKLLNNPDLLIAKYKGN
jgi:predicted nucleotidyltransferase